jgi:hypothetical protein
VETKTCSYFFRSLVNLPLPYVRPPRLHTTCLWAPVALSLSFRHASPVLHPNPNAAATPDALHRAPTAAATPDARSPAFLPRPPPPPLALLSFCSSPLTNRLLPPPRRASASGGRIRRRARSWPCRGGRMHAQYRQQPLDLALRRSIWGRRGRSGPALSTLRTTSSQFLLAAFVSFDTHIATYIDVGSPTSC